MGAGSLTAANWTVSTRQDGEVLAIWAGNDELQLGVFATRDGFSPLELDGWLKDLVNVAAESARQDVSAREIPPLLHHALTGLLFSHAELWEREGGMYFSTALVSVDGLAGVGWVGEADLQVHVEGVPQEVDWVVVRDTEGREARAATFDASLPLRIWVSWNPGMDEKSGVAVDAEWSPEPLEAGDTRAAGGARLIELTADDLAPVADELEVEAEPDMNEGDFAPTVEAEQETYEPEVQDAGAAEPEAAEPEAVEQLQTAADFEDEAAQLQHSLDFESESDSNQRAPDIEAEAAPEGGTAGRDLVDDFVREAEFTPPRSRAPSAIAQAFDLDRFGTVPFEDALEVAPEQPAAVEMDHAAEAIGSMVEWSPPAPEPDEASAAIEEAPAEAIEPAPAEALELEPAEAVEPAPAEALELEPAEAVEPALAGMPEPESLEAGAGAESVAAPADASAIDSVTALEGADATEGGAAIDEEVEAEAKRKADLPSARRTGMWGRVANLWKRRGKRAAESDEDKASLESIAEAAHEVPMAPAQAPEPVAEPAAEVEAKKPPAETRKPAPPAAPEPRAAQVPAVASHSEIPPVPDAPAKPKSISALAASRAEAPRLQPASPPAARSATSEPGAPSAPRLVIEPRDRALAPAAPGAATPGQPLIIPRDQAVAPIQPEVEQRPARLTAPPSIKPGGASPGSEPATPPVPGEPEAAKPPALPEDRLGAIVRTSPERPSLRATPAERESAPSAPPRAKPTVTPPAARPGGMRPTVRPAAAPAPATPVDAAPAHESVAAGEPVAAAEPIPAQAPEEEKEKVAPAMPARESAVPEAAPEAPPEEQRKPARKPRESEAPAAAAAPVAAAAPAEAAARAPIRAQWPSEDEMTSPLVRMARVAFGSLLVGALFMAGWLLGGVTPEHGEQEHKTNPVMQLLQGFSFASGRYHVAVTTEPDGAQVAVDGKDVAKRTPATIDLKPGAHQVTLSYPELGSATFGVRGARDQNVTLHEALWGRLSVEQDNPDVPVSVSIDGRDLGFAPVTIDSVSPGAHEVRFSGPNMTPWAQTVAVKVRESARIVAHPMVSPATGVLSVRATLNDAQGSTPLAGGEVWLDGELVGRTPLTLELPRGPHSVKVVYGQESAAVQVIDLPGGNQRFAAFQLGNGGPDLRLTPASVVTRVTPDQPALVSAGMDGVNVSDVREMWLHVRGPDDNWRRYALNVMKTPTGVVGVSTFPLGVFDDSGLTKYYLSALLITGDEYFTEIASAQLVNTPGASGAN